MEFGDFFVDVDSAKIHCVEWKTKGKPNGNTILLIHGTAQTAHTYDEFVEYFSESGFRLIGIDQRGHGDSSWSKDGEYSLSILTKDLENVIEKLNLNPESLIIIGMSLGGLISLKYTSNLYLQKKKLLSLIIVDITPYVKKENVGYIKQATQQSLTLDSFEDFIKWAKTFNPTRSEENLKNRLKYSLKKKEDGKWTWKYDPIIISYSRDDETDELWNILKNIECPTLIIRGLDSKVTTKEMVEKMKSLLPNGEYIDIKNAGHSVQGDNPKDMYLGVSQFLSQKSKL